MPVQANNTVSAYDKPITIIKRTNTSQIGYEEQFTEETIHNGYAHIYINNGGRVFTDSTGSAVKISANITLRDFSRSCELDYDCIIVNGINRFKPDYIEKDKGFIKIISTSWVEN